MTKEEKIKEAYGEYWEPLKQRIDDNGWYKCLSFRDRMSLIETADDNGRLMYNHFFVGKKSGGIDYLMPLSLKGIERNHGWIKIESEADLPKEDGMYWGIYKDDPEPICIRLLNSKPIVLFGCLTYLKPIEKPKPPIY